MEVKTLPHSLKDITLEKYVEWYTAYGYRLLKTGRRKHTSEDDRAAFQLDSLLKHYAWYSDTPLEDVLALAEKEGDDTVVEIIKESTLSMSGMFQELCQIEYVDFNTMTFEFKGGTFKIAPPVLVNDPTKVTVAQFEKCQDIALIFSDLQDEKFDALYMLCAEYITAVDESDIKSSFWTQADMDTRCVIVKSLPLQIAMCVKGFVTNTINLYKHLKRD